MTNRRIFEHKMYLFLSFLLLFYLTNQAPTREDSTKKFVKLVQQIGKMIDEYYQKKNPTILPLLNQKLKILSKVTIPPQQKQRVENMQKAAKEFFFLLSLPKKKPHSLFRRQGQMKSEEQITLISKQSEVETVFDKQSFTIIAPPKSLASINKTIQSVKQFDHSDKKTQQFLDECTVKLVCQSQDHLRIKCKQIQGDKLKQYKELLQLIAQQRINIKIMALTMSTEHQSILQYSQRSLQYLQQQLKNAEKTLLQEKALKDNTVYIPPAPSLQSQEPQLKNFQNDSLQGYLQQQQPIRSHAQKITNSFSNTNSARKLFLMLKHIFLRYDQAQKEPVKYNRQIADYISNLKYSLQVLQKQFDYRYQQLHTMNVSRYFVALTMIKLQQNLNMRIEIEKFLSKKHYYLSEYQKNNKPQIIIPAAPTNPSTVIDFIPPQREQFLAFDISREKKDYLQSKIGSEFAATTTFMFLYKSLLKCNEQIKSTATPDKQLIQQIIQIMIECKKYQRLLQRQFQKRYKNMKRAVSQDQINITMRKLQQNLNLRTAFKKFCEQQQGNFQKYHKLAIRHLQSGQSQHLSSQKDFKIPFASKTPKNISEMLAMNNKSALHKYQNKSEEISRIVKFVEHFFPQTNSYIERFYLLVKFMKQILFKNTQEKRKILLKQIHVSMQGFKNYQNILLAQFQQKQKILNEKLPQITIQIINQKLQQNVNLRHHLSLYFQQHKFQINCYIRQQQMFRLETKKQQIKVKPYKKIPPAPTKPNLNRKFIFEGPILGAFPSSKYKTTVLKKFSLQSKYLCSLKIMLRSIQMLQKTAQKEQKKIYLKNILKGCSILRDFIPSLKFIFDHYYQLLVKQSRQKIAVQIQMTLIKLQQTTDLIATIQIFLSRNEQNKKKYERQLQMLNL